jgi:uncharacterized membrane protein YtjA (UPF0391 family)
VLVEVKAVPFSFGPKLAIFALGGSEMLQYALLFLILALIAGALGFFALAGLAASIAKVLFVVFLVVFLVGFITGRRAV